MKRARLLFFYQLLTGLSDTITGALLVFAPALTLRLMHVSSPQDLLFVSYVGVFVFSTGLACLYGMKLTASSSGLHSLKVVWLLTAITRGLVASFVSWKMESGALDLGWSSVIVTDGLLAAIQFLGLARGWLTDASA